MSPNPTIIAIGGGGFTHNEDSELDDICLSYARRRVGLVTSTSCTRPSIGFVGLASDDDVTKITLFYERFKGVATCSHLQADTNLYETQHWCMGLDLIYFGGGNTKNLIIQMQTSRVDQLFYAAYQAGTVIAGVSAGAGCWFSQILSDSSGAGLAPLAGLGWLEASLCPHYSEEPHRRLAFEALIASSELSAGYAIDDGAGIIFENGQTAGYITARPNAAAYFIRQDKASAETMTLDEVRNIPL
tara:strand:+ start:673 stop:1404 length:732 start_codon:yes stop_codon:yes gene_type:complete